jgi:hypothetical protein
MGAHGSKERLISPSRTRFPSLKRGEFKEGMGHVLVLAGEGFRRKATSESHIRLTDEAKQTPEVLHRPEN